MFQIKGLTISHRKDLHPLLQDFSMTLRPGDRAVIIGEEGNGKSTLLKWIHDPAFIDDYAEARGERILTGERTGYLPQELPAQDLDKTVSAYFAESEAFCKTAPGQLIKTAERLSVPMDFFRSVQRMRTLSGGEKVKAQLLRLLFEEPTVLLLDEPSNDIDIEALEWLERFIAGTRAAVLFISHDETLIERTANVVIHMEQLRRKSVCRHTVYRGTYTDYLNHRTSVMQNQTALAVSQRKTQREHEEKLRRIMQKVERDQAQISRQDPSGGRLLKKKMHAVKAMEHRFDRDREEMENFPETAEAMFIRFDDRRCTMPAGKTVLDLSLDRLESPDGSRILSQDIRLLVRGPEKLCIIGENGAGKTTLIRKIAEELLPRRDLHAVYMPQDYGDVLDPERTPVDFLSQSGDREERTRIRTYLGSLKFTTEEMEHRIGGLSGGQKAKLLLLRISLSGADVMILDEPTRNLSPLSGPVVRSTLQRFPGTIISISHDRKFISEVCGTVLLLDRSGLHRDRTGRFRPV